MHKKISSTDFIHAFSRIWNSVDRRVCFILGAGASKSSGIKTGGELAGEWLDDIKRRLSDRDGTFETFIAEKGIDVKNPGAHYPIIYDECFGDDPAAGFEYINREMEPAKPGYGYSVLAQILSSKHHNVVITTNFDSLTEEALYTYTDKRPLICGHESLAAFAKPSLNRPLIVKIHRDRFFDPQSTSEEVGQINKAWVDALSQIFKNCIPIFIGYGGNDGSLMGFLKAIDKFENIFWCERRGTAISKSVTEFLDKNRGKLVEIEGFDELMFLLQGNLSLDRLDDKIKIIAEKRAEEYRGTFERIMSSQSKSPEKEVQDAAEKIIGNAGDDWWAWELKVQAAKTNKEKENLYISALEILPTNAKLIGNYALFLHTVEKRYPEAEELYKKALEIDVSSANAYGNYAMFLAKIKRNYDLAENYFKKALEISPMLKNATINYATFLYSTRKKYDDAESLYKKSIELYPDSINAHVSYAMFLYFAKRSYDEAEKHFLIAIGIDPRSAFCLFKYATFLTHARKDYEKASFYYETALEISPNNPELNSSYALFLQEKGDDWNNVDYYYKKAIDLDNNNSNCKANYAGFLLRFGKTQLASKYISEAMANCRETVAAELFFYNYAHFDHDMQNNLTELKQLLCSGVRSIGFNIQKNVDKAIQDGHSNPELLQRLADILTKDAPIGDLCEGIKTSLR